MHENFDYAGLQEDISNKANTLQDIDRHLNILRKAELRGPSLHASKDKLRELDLAVQAQTRM